jgi:hypothetical protein
MVMSELPTGAGTLHFVLGKQAPVRATKRAGGVPRCFQRPSLCLNPATIPPLRGRRSRSRAEEKTGRSGRDDRKTMTGAGVAG